MKVQKKKLLPGGTYREYNFSGFLDYEDTRVSCSTWWHGLD